MKRVPSAIPRGVDFELLGEVLAHQGEDFLAGHRVVPITPHPRRHGRPRARRDQRRPRAAAPRCARPRRPRRSGPQGEPRWRFPRPRSCRGRRRRRPRRPSRIAPPVVSGWSSRRRPPRAGRISRPPRAASGLERAASRIARGDGLRRALHQLQRDVAGKAVGDDDVGRAGRKVAPLDVAGELDPLGPGEDLVGLGHLLATLAGLLADREQADPRSLDAEHGLAEGGAKESELDQVLGAHLDVGADVEEEHRLARDGELDRERRSLHPLQPAQAEGRRRHRRPGRARAGHRVGSGPRRRRRPRAQPRPPSWSEPRRRGPLRCRSTPRWQRPRPPRPRRVQAPPTDRRPGSESRPPPPCARPRRARRSPARPRSHRGRRSRRAGANATPSRRACAVGSGDRVFDHLATRVRAAGGADAVRQARAVATGAAVEPCLACLVLGAPLVAAGAGSSLLRDGHRSRDGSGWVVGARVLSRGEGGTAGGPRSVLDPLPRATRARAAQSSC